MPPWEQLASKYDQYVSMMPTPEQAFSDSCDGLLFASLMGAGDGKEFPVETWRGDDGAWFRNPDHGKCKPTSRDMYLGLFWYIWAAKRRDLADDIWSYGAPRSFVMDDRNPKISVLFPDSQWTLALLERRLGGDEHESWKLAAPCVGSLTGFEAHLQSLVSGLRALMDFGDTLNEDCLKSMAKRQPNNAWFAALAGIYSGNQETARDMLLDDKYCPSGRLPTSADRCEPWLWQRDESEKDWGACPDEGLTHSGGDCAIAMAVTLGKLR